MKCGAALHGRGAGMVAGAAPLVARHLHLEASK
jgi:hypothetical protein